MNHSYMWVQEDSNNKTAQCNKLQKQKHKKGKNCRTEKSTVTASPRPRGQNKKLEVYVSAIHSYVQIFKTWHFCNNVILCSYYLHLSSFFISWGRNGREPWDDVSTFLSVTPLDIFSKTSGNCVGVDKNRYIKTNTLTFLQQVCVKPDNSLYPSMTGRCFTKPPVPSQRAQLSRF